MNGYFRLVNEKGKSSIKLIPPTENGKVVDLNDVIVHIFVGDERNRYNLDGLYSHLIN